MGLGRIYTFGPTFRAENSNTTRHLAEFWMIEPEVAFNNLEDNIDLAEDFLKYVIKYVLDHCKDDLEFLDKRFEEEQKSKPEKDREQKKVLSKSLKM
jgi:asparaginyl-tRNA synthetase